MLHSELSLIDWWSDFPTAEIDFFASFQLYSVKSRISFIPSHSTRIINQEGDNASMLSVILLVIRVLLVRYINPTRSPSENRRIAKTNDGLINQNSGTQYNYVTRDDASP